MFIFKQLSQKLNEKLNVNQIALNSISINEAEIVNLNTNEQIYKKSIDADGTKLKRKGASYPVYSDNYEKYKKRRGKYQGYIDLSLDGDYLESYKIYLYDDHFIIEADEIKVGKYDLSQLLRVQYSEQIEGLTEENIKKIASIILTDFQKNFAKDFKEAIKLL